MKTPTDASILFEEVQRFARKPVHDFFKVLMAIVFLSIVVNLFMHTGRVTDFGWGMIILFSILFIINIILGSKLILQIRTDGIHIRFPPWQPGFSSFYWTNISAISVRPYDAMREFFGWGIRFAPGKTGYIVAGNTGIDIRLANGRSILITTQSPDEINEVLRKLGKF